MTIHTLQQMPLPRTEPAATDTSPIIGDRVELQLLTTLKCNLKCTYCSLGVGEVLGSQNELRYDIDQLARFVDTHLAGSADPKPCDELARRIRVEIVAGLARLARDLAARGERVEVLDLLAVELLGIE